MKILVLDNYDSFTYNLVHQINEIGGFQVLDVVRNDKIMIDHIVDYDKILLSPGPGVPDSAGIMKELIREYANSKSILGICLGHQGIAEVFGAKIFNMTEVLHGIPGTVKVLEDDETLFQGVPKEFTASHYHSWAVDKSSINGALKVTAEDDEGLVMGLSHSEYDVKGLQFHPESILTEEGSKIIENWIKN